MENMIKKIVDADNEAKAMEKDTLEEKRSFPKLLKPKRRRFMTTSWQKLKRL